MGTEKNARPARLSWWRTDILDEAGARDLPSRLTPRTQEWAALEAVREAAWRVDERMRLRSAVPGARRSALSARTAWSSSLRSVLTWRAPRRTECRGEPLELDDVTGAAERLERRPVEAPRSPPGSPRRDRLGRRHPAALVRRELIIELEAQMEEGDRPVRHRGLSTVHNYNFAILPYEPEDELKLRDRIKRHSHELKAEGWAVCSIALHRLLKRLGEGRVESLIERERALAEDDPEGALEHLTEILV